MPVVVIDPGHGGKTAVGGSSANNAKGPMGLLEKTVTLDIASRVRAALRGMGIEVQLTRQEDRNIGLIQQANFARDRAADAFVSIHFNGFNGAVQGTETFHHVDASSDSVALASAVQAAVLKVTQYANRRAKPGKYGVINPVHHHHNTAACLLEVSFMDVLQEERRLADEGYKSRIADAIATSIVGWLIADLRLPLNHAGFALHGDDALELAELEDGFAALHSNEDGQQA